MSSGSANEVWLIRHGETGANAARVIQGQTDEPLSEKGVLQAEALAAWLARERRPRPTAVVTSPLARARRTAEIATAALEVSLLEEPRVMERSFGEWELRSAAEVYAEQDGAAPDPFDVKPPGGESTHEMAARVASAFDDWALRDDVGERLFVFTHGGPIGALVCRALDLPYNALTIRRFARDNTGVTVLRRKKRERSAFLVDTLNARFHLDGH